MGQLLGASNIISPGGALIVIILIVVAAIRVFYMLKRSNGRRAKCPKCGGVFETSNISIVRLGPFRNVKCPVCGRTSIMRLGTKEPLTWPKEDDKNDRPVKEDEIDRRIRDSKYE